MGPETGNVATRPSALRGQDGAALVGKWLAQGMGGV
jgi:hypothetical protein